MTLKFWTAVFGWLVTLLPFFCYCLCLEPSVSLWDCGEFLAAANKLQVVHPPGAPLYLLIGRVAALLAPDAEKVALFVNGLSALSSAMTVYFTYHSVILLLRDFENSSQLSKRLPKGASIIAASVSALALAFSDTFWFSAVETEVYALSSFFTALTFWAALKWYYDNSLYANKKLILIAYLLGLAIGAHLLSLLVIPSVSFLYFFKMKKQGLKNMSYAFLAGLAVLFFIQNGIIPGLPKLFAESELFFVNTLGLGFDSGILSAIVVIFAALAYGIYYFGKVKKNAMAQLSLLCLCYLLLGFGSYTMVVVRSREELPVDMNNPEEPFNLKYYINREQYEERPLLKGPYFNAEAIDVKEGASEYRKDKNAYTFTGNKQSYVFDPAYSVMFPRMSDMQKSSSPSGYRSWSGMTEIENEIQYLEQNLSGLSNEKLSEAKERIKELKAEKPAMANNLRYFFDYQLNHMYFRYFMWNFAGRQNDIQGHSYNRLLDGNWMSGIPFLDRMRLGPQDSMPAEMSQNKGRNVYFLIPLLLGIAGIYWHFKNDRKLFTVTGILFLFTGVLIIVFLNQPPYEPRERDYVHVGSFQVFCIWIGIGCIQLFTWMKKRMRSGLALLVSGCISLSAPVLMMSQGWDDHDRSGRYIALDLAKDILDSCPENAIFLGNADNDTYPVWYAQNVLGYRTDVRVINQNLLPSDWYSKQLLSKVYKSEPFKMQLTPKDLDKGVNDYYQWRPAADSEQPVELNEFIQSLISNNTGYFSKHRLYVKVNKSKDLKENLVKWPNEDIQDTMNINLPQRGLHKGDLVLLALVAEWAKSGFERPICFSTIAGDDGYEAYVNYIRKRGMVYELYPLFNRQSGRDIRAQDIETTYALLMEKFSYGGIKNNPDFYIDDKSQIFPQTLRNMFIELAGHYLGKKLELENAGDTTNPEIAQLKGKVNALLQKCELELPEKICQPQASEYLNLANIWWYMNDREKATSYLEKANKLASEKLNYYRKFISTQYGSDYIASLVGESMNIMEKSRECNKNWNLNSQSLKFDKAFEQLKKDVNLQLSY